MTFIAIDRCENPQKPSDSFASEHAVIIDGTVMANKNPMKYLIAIRSIVVLKHFVKGQNVLTMTEIKLIFFLPTKAIINFVFFIRFYQWKKIGPLMPKTILRIQR